MDIDNFSNFMSFDRFVFIANGTFNGFEANIFCVNTDNAQSDLLYRYPDGVFGDRPVLLVGLQGGKLYYASNTDSEVGRELYALETGIEDLVSTASVPSRPKPDFQFPASTSW